MKEFIVQYWLQAIFGTTIMGLGFAFKKLWSRVKSTVLEQDAIKMGIQALLRDRIIQSYNKHLDTGYIPIYALENVEAMYIQYHNLGGNGTITKLVEKMRDMPTEPEKEK